MVTVPVVFSISAQSILSHLVDPATSLRASAVQVSVDPMVVRVCSAALIPSVLAEILSLLVPHTLFLQSKAQVQMPATVIGGMKVWQTQPVLHAR